MSISKVFFTIFLSVLVSCASNKTASQDRDDDGMSTSLTTSTVDEDIDPSSQDEAMSQDESISDDSQSDDSVALEQEALERQRIAAEQEAQAERARLESLREELSRQEAGGDELVNSVGTNGANDTLTATATQLSNDEPIAETESIPEEVTPEPQEVASGPVAPTEEANDYYSEGNVVIQFFASKSGEKIFEDLDKFGKVMIEEVSGQNLFRYNLGYFRNRVEAEIVLEEIKSAGWSDAFVKEVER